MSYRPSLKKLKKNEIERVADRIVDYIIRKDRSIVKISAMSRQQRTHIILSLYLDENDAKVCLAELGYDYPTEKLREQMYQSVINRVAEMFQAYDEKLKREGKKPRGLRIIRTT